MHDSKATCSTQHPPRRQGQPVPSVCVLDGFMCVLDRVRSILKKKGIGKSAGMAEWSTGVSLRLVLGVLRDQICTTQGSQVDCVEAS